MRQTYIFLLAYLACSALLVSLFALSMPATERFIFLFGFDMERPLVQNTPHYSDLTAALDDLAGTGITGVVHTSLGHAEELFARSDGAKGLPDEQKHNADVFALANARGVNMWLSARIVNAITPNGIQATFDSATSAGPLRDYFDSTFVKSVATYSGPGAPYANNCTVVLFEDDSPYHRRDGGGLYWLEDAWPKENNMPSPLMTPPSTEHDTLYASKFPVAYMHYYSLVQKVNPTCRVGLHISNYSLTRTIEGVPVISKLLESIPASAQPSFMLFDSFMKRYATQADHKKEFTQRVMNWRKALPDSMKVFTTAQLHTSNMVGYGLGRTPSLEQLTENIRYAKESGVDGFGYLGKDHEATHTTLQTIAATPKEAAHIHCTHIYPAGGMGVTHAQMGHEMMGYELPDGTYKSINKKCSAEEDVNPFAPNSKEQRLLWVPDPMSGVERWKKAVGLLKEF
jgi:hypothetical protein